MSDMKGGTRPRYETPTVVVLGGLARGSGACTAGSGDTDTCTAGGLAGTACSAGGAATSGCTAGTILGT